MGALHHLGIPALRASVAFALAGFAAACAPVSAPAVQPAAISHSEHLVPLLASPPYAFATPNDAVVRVVGPEMTCSGTLVDDDLVLTAHHCVVKLARGGVFTRESVTPSDVQIELGGDYLAWGTVRARAVVAPPCGAAGGAGDLAILVLERKLVGMTPMEIRLEAPPRMGEMLDPIGFGRCRGSMENGIHRSGRPGGPVVGTTQETFVVNASICPGDSGGPILARGSRQIVGVISQSAMDGDESTRDISVFARLDVYRAVFAAARQIADGADPSELPPLACAP